MDRYMPITGIDCTIASLLIDTEAVPFLWIRFNALSMHDEYRVAQPCLLLRNR